MTGVQTCALPIYQNVTILPDKLFIRALASQDLEQDEEVLKPWVDPHKLKQISGTWWKGNQLVITADIPLGLIMGPGPHRLPAGIPVGIPAGSLTRGSGSS